MGRLAGVLVVALLAGCAAVRPEGDVVRVEAPAPPADGKVKVGQGYFDFTARDLAGREMRLSSLVGPKVVLLQFWGIRCAPCLAEMGFLSDLQDRLGPRGLQVIGVNTDRVDAGALARAMRERGLEPSYPIVLDADFSISRHYTNWLIPVTVLIDRRGVVRVIHTGYKPELGEKIARDVAQTLGRQE